MTDIEAILDRLRAANHFILQVEGGRVDHAAHNSDAASAIHEQIALDAALEVCLEFQRNTPDTLIVVTTDHGNSNLGLNGAGAAYGQSNPQFAHLSAVRASYGEMIAMAERLEGAYAAVQNARLVREAAQVYLTRGLARKA